MRRLIRADGTSQDLPQPISIAEINRLIGAQVTDTVNLRHLGQPLHVMVVDDLGYETEQVEPIPGQIELRPIRARKPVNEEATRLYLANCRPGTTHQIVGDVVVVPDEDFA
ncbi:hypothetical protein ABXN37_19660 [Piscinibacter sakaiensis]|uniref:Uncharacterized protein n=1 Tax=Piscinibacter sakaiensis TaxID=1547922 RepID=A0A0K8P467_PISS1|nr:hypothetical protein [Piscinibacter sakaiensis]GAP37344.1 hypothetical protein ISF6_3199 [Piscinibacter sakaiensis]